MAIHKAKQKQVEWEPTAEPWVVDRGFSIFVKNRCVFFHARAKNIKKRFNYAVKFVNPNRIVVLYIYGQVKEQTVAKLLKDVANQMLVIMFPINPDDLAAYDDSCTTNKLIGGWGVSEQDIRSNLASALEQKKQHADSDVLDKYISDTYEHVSKLDAGKIALNNIEQCQHEPATMLSNFMDKRMILADHNEELLSIICNLFPYGVEANASSEIGAKMLHRKRLVDYAFNGKITDLVTQCVGDLDDPKGGASLLLREVQNYCTGRICEQGFFSISDLMRVLAAPPYGWYDCNYYVYLRARILEQYAREPYMVYVGVAAFPFGTEADGATWLQSPNGIVFVEGAKQKQMCDSLSTLFPKERSQFNRTSGVCAEITYARRWISEHVSTPLACADTRWYEVLRADGANWCDRLFCEQYYEFLTDIQSRQKEIEMIDHLFDDVYPSEKLRLFYQFYHVQGGAVGWLFSADDFKKRIERYMQSCICRECGRMIEGEDFKDGVVYVAQDEDGRILRFTKKDTIGLNKKLLGRYQEEFFCIPCLCEILDTDAERLHEKIHRFKEQGCTLFM